MKVLFFSHQAEFIYGGEIVTLEFMRELAARGVAVQFASPPGPYFDRAQELGVRCHPVGSRQFSRRVSELPGIALSLAQTHFALRTITARAGIDVLHATSLKAMVSGSAHSPPARR